MGPLPQNSETHMPAKIYRKHRWTRKDAQLQGPENPNFLERQEAANYPEVTFNPTESPWPHCSELAGMETALSHPSLSDQDAQVLSLGNTQD